MILRRTDEDLFRESTMTFGEHLEELRKCLWKAIAGLAIGFLFGLLLSDWVVQQIHKPLRTALETYYQKQSLRKAKAEMEELQAAGYPKEFLKTVEDDYLIGEVCLVSREEFQRELGIVAPSQDSRAGHPQRASNPQKDNRNQDGGDSEQVDAEQHRLVRVHLWRSLEDDLRVVPKSLSAHEAFGIFIKAALLVGIVVSSPWMFWQIWRFVAAGLYFKERKFVYIFLPFSLGLFLSGVAVAFLLVMKPVLDFLFTFNDMLKIDPDPRISEWLSFVLMLPLGFGIAFQLPLVMLFLERIGIFSVEAYMAKWRVAILVIFIISMLLTPADPTSMMLMAVPLTGLYFGGVVLCRFFPRSRSPYDDEDEE